MNAPVLKLSNAFSAILTEWLADDMTEVNKRNSEPEYIENGYCATHEFCDPNQAMIDAFKECFSKEPDTQIEEDNQIINEAWTLSRTNKFKQV